MKKMAKTKTKMVSHNPWVVGEKYFIRTVTMSLTGRLVSAGEQELVLSDASWIADTGRFMQAVKTGVFSEVEPYGDNLVIVGRGSVIDATIVEWELPKVQK